MTSTNDEKDVKSNQTSCQKDKSYYIGLYKSIDGALSSECGLSARAAALCSAWRRVHTLCAHSAPVTHAHLLSWLQAHTARTVLQTEWQDPNLKDEHEKLEEAINDFISECQAASSARQQVLAWEQTLLARAERFKVLLLNPWDHPVLKVLLDPSGEQPDDQKLIEWLKEECGVVFAARLRQLAMSKNCADLALLLLSAVTQRARAAAAAAPPDADLVLDKVTPQTEDEQSFRSILTREAGFERDVWDLLTDLEFVLLHKSDKDTRLIELAKQTPLTNGYPIVDRLLKRLSTAPREKKIWKNAKDVATLIAQVLITRCMVVGVCGGAVRTALYWCARALVRGLAAARLPKACAALAAPAATARHLHTFARAVHAEQTAISPDLKSFVVELYVRAITFGMNELEKLKLKPEKEKEARATEQTLASWFTQLGQLLAGSARMQCECALTAFSVHPAPAMFDLIRDAPPLPPVEIPELKKDEPAVTSEFGSWANDSRSMTNFVKTSETLNLKHSQHHANVLSTAILTEGETLGLEAELCQDIAVLLSGPRVKTFSWDMDREALLESCRRHMERTGGGTRALTTELKFLNLDPSHYLHLPEELDDEDDIYYGIEKGYEHHIEIEPQPEEIWEDALLDPEQTDTCPSSSDEEVSVRRKKRNKHIVYSDYDSDHDPLSLVAENKRAEKKKERPHSKERSKERKKKPKHEKRKQKKEKKERKKKDPKNPLSNLIGLKVVVAKSTDFVAVTSDDDSQKSDSNVVYDGQFSIDDMKSPDRTLTKAERPKDPLTCILAAQRIQAVTGITKPPPITQVMPAPAKSAQEMKEEVKKSIVKLINFRRQKASEQSLSNSPLSSPSHSQSPKPDLTSPPPPVNMSAFIGAKIQNTLQFDPKQTERLQAMKTEVNKYLNRPSTAIYYPKQMNTAQDAKSASNVSAKKPNSAANITQNFPASVNVTHRPNVLHPTKQAAEQRKSSITHLNSYQEFVKNWQASVKAEVSSPSPKSRKPPKPATRVTPVSTDKPKDHTTTPQSAKPIVQQKKVENAPNTFARLSYMHKNKQNEKPKPIESNLQNSVSEELDRRIDELRKAQAKSVPSDLLISRVGSSMCTAKNETSKYENVRSEVKHENARQENVRSENFNTMRPFENTKHEKAKAEVQKIGNLQTLSFAAENHQLLSSLLNGTAVSVKKCNESHPSAPGQKPQATPKTAKTNNLTERDQQDIMKLLGQKNRLNEPTRIVHPTTSEPRVCNTAQSLVNPTTMLKAVAPTAETTKMVPKKSPVPHEGFFQFPLISNRSILKTAELVQTKKPRQPQCKKVKKTTPDGVQPALEANKTAIAKKYTPKPPVSTPKLLEENPEQDWTKVFDALRSQKTPRRGPNAIEMVINKEMFDKANEGFNQRLETTKEHINKIMNAHNNLVQTVIAKPSTSATDKTISYMPANKVDQTQNAQLKRTDRPSNLVIHRDETKQPSQPVLQKADDPFISGIPNSDYEILEELMDDDLRKEIGELSSDEDNYRSAGPSKTKMQSNAKNVSVIKPNIQSKMPAEVINPNFMINAQKSGNTAALSTAPKPKAKPRIISNEKVDFGTLPPKVVSNVIRSSSATPKPRTVPALNNGVITLNNNVQNTLSTAVRNPVTANVQSSSIANVQNPMNTQVQNDENPFYDALDPQVQNMVVYDPYTGMYNLDQSFIPVVNTAAVAGGYQQGLAAVHTPIVTHDAVSVTAHIPVISANIGFDNNHSLPFIPTEASVPTPAPTPIQRPEITSSNVKVNNSVLKNHRQKPKAHVGNAPESVPSPVVLNKTGTLVNAPLMIPDSNRNSVPMEPKKINVVTNKIHTPSELKAPKTDVSKSCASVEPAPVIVGLNKNLVIEPIPKVVTSKVSQPAESKSANIDAMKLCALVEPSSTMLDTNKNSTPIEPIPTKVESNKTNERKVLSEVQEKLKVPTITASEKLKQLKDQERVAKKRLAIINRNIYQRCFYPPIPLTYAPLKEKEVQKTEDPKLVNTVAKSEESKPGTETQKEVDVSVSENAKENKDVSFRSILLRSSGKLKDIGVVPLSENPVGRKTKVRLKKTKAITNNAEKIKKKVIRKPKKQPQDVTKTNENGLESKKANNDSAPVTPVRVSKRILDKKEKTTELHGKNAKPEDITVQEKLLNSTENKNAYSSIKTLTDIEHKIQGSKILKTDDISKSLQATENNNKSKKKIAKKESGDNLESVREDTIKTHIKTTATNVDRKITNQTSPKVTEKGLVEAKKATDVQKKPVKQPTFKINEKQPDNVVEILSSPEICEDDPMTKLAPKILSTDEKLDDINLEDNIDLDLAVFEEPPPQRTAKTTSKDIILVARKPTNDQTQSILKKNAKESVTEVPKLTPENVLLDKSKLEKEDSALSDKTRLLGKLPFKNIETQNRLSKLVDDMECTINAITETTISSHITENQESKIDSAKENIGEGGLETNTEQQTTKNPVNDIDDMSNIIPSLSDEESLKDPKTILKPADEIKENIMYKSNEMASDDLDLTSTKDTNVDSINDTSRETINNLAVDNDIAESILPILEPTNIKGPKKMSIDVLRKYVESTANATLLHELDTCKSKQLEKSVDAMKNAHHSIENNKDTEIIKNIDTVLQKNTQQVAKPINFENQFNTNTQAKDVPQSYKDSIKIQELSSPGPNKRCIRLVFPNGKVFKATIHGKMEISFDTLFEDPAVRTILMSHISTKKRITLSLLQSKDSTVIRDQTVEDKVNVNTAPVETVNLISDDEDDVTESTTDPAARIEQVMQTLTTPSGTYKIQTMEESLLAQHQKKISMKLTIPLERCDRKPKTKALVNALLDDISHTLAAINQPVPKIDPKNVIEIDDSSDDDFPLVTKPEVKIDDLKSKLLKDLAVALVHNSPDSETKERPSRTRKSTFDKDPDMVFTDLIEKRKRSTSRSKRSKDRSADIKSKRKLSVNLRDKLQVLKTIPKKCCVKLVRCDHMLSNEREDNEVEIITGDIINKDISSEVEVFGVVNRASANSPVMEVFDMIAKLDNSQKTFKEKSASIGASHSLTKCGSDWFATKQSIRAQDMTLRKSITESEHINRLDESDCETYVSNLSDSLNESLTFEVPSLISIVLKHFENHPLYATEVLSINQKETISTNHYKVPTLKSIMFKYFEDSSLLEQLKPIVNVPKSTSFAVKRKLLGLEDSTVAKIPAKIMVETNHPTSEDMQKNIDVTKFCFDNYLLEDNAEIQLVNEDNLCTPRSEDTENVVESVISHILDEISCIIEKDTPKFIESGDKLISKESNNVLTSSSIVDHFIGGNDVKENVKDSIDENADDEHILPMLDEKVAEETSFVTEKVIYEEAKLHEIDSTEMISAKISCIIEKDTPKFIESGDELISKESNNVLTSSWIVDHFTGGNDVKENVKDSIDENADDEPILPMLDEKVAEETSFVTEKVIYAEVKLHEIDGTEMISAKVKEHPNISEQISTDTNKTTESDFLNPMMVESEDFNMSELEQTVESDKTSICSEDKVMTVVDEDINTKADTLMQDDIEPVTNVNSTLTAIDTDCADTSNNVNFSTLPSPVRYNSQINKKETPPHSVSEAKIKDLVSNVEATINEQNTATANEIATEIREQADMSDTNYVRKEIESQQTETHEMEAVKTGNESPSLVTEFLDSVLLGLGSDEVHDNNTLNGGGEDIQCSELDVEIRKGDGIMKENKVLEKNTEIESVEIIACDEKTANSEESILQVDVKDRNNENFKESCIEQEYLKPSENNEEFSNKNMTYTKENELHREDANEGQEDETKSESPSTEQEHLKMSENTETASDKNLTFAEENDLEIENVIEEEYGSRENNEEVPYRNTTFTKQDNYQKLDIVSIEQEHLERNGRYENDSYENMLPTDNNELDVANKDVAGQEDNKKSDSPSEILSQSKEDLLNSHTDVVNLIQLKEPELSSEIELEKDKDVSRTDGTLTDQKCSEKNISAEEVMHNISECEDLKKTKTQEIISESRLETITTIKNEATIKSKDTHHKSNVTTEVCTDLSDVPTEIVDWVDHETVVGSEISESDKSSEDIHISLIKNLAQAKNVVEDKTVDSKQVQTESQELDCEIKSEVKSEPCSSTPSVINAQSDISIDSEEIKFELEQNTSDSNEAKVDKSSHQQNSETKSDSENEGIYVKKCIKEVDFDENILEKNATLIYKDDSGVILKGIEYEDAEIGPCFVFPIQSCDESSASVLLNNTSGSSTIEVISNQTLSDDEKSDIDLEVIVPKFTYSRRSLKRKSNMKDIDCSETKLRRTSRSPRRSSRSQESSETKATERKYRKGKNIDAYKLTPASIADSNYRKSYKQVIDYMCSIEFSYSVAFGSEYIDVPDLLTDWPIKGPVLKECQQQTDDSNNLFADLEHSHTLHDPMRLPLGEELKIEYNDDDYSNDTKTKEASFNMGFGEGSGRVIQNLNGGAISKFSAATLSDVKQSQPLLLSEKYSKNYFHETVKNDQVETLKRFFANIQLRDKVRSYFKNSTIELSCESDKEKGSHYSQDVTFPFELYIPRSIAPQPLENIVQVVQVGQLPVSAAAQNPVTCDPRVTQVSDASPSQCSVENSPHDDSQQGIKTEYTELTTADLSLPLVEDYVQHTNQTVNIESQDTNTMSMSSENIPIQTELVKSEVKIEIVEETSEEKEKFGQMTSEERENSDLADTNKHVNNVEYLYDTNNTVASVDSDIQALFGSGKSDTSDVATQQKAQNGSMEKTDQIAHAMNAAGITPVSETVTNTRAHALVNILSQKIRQGGVTTTQNSTGNFSKTTSINAMALQQALAQILPPPLNQTNSSENNQQGQNSVTPQVLHIVQGKNASGNQITLVDNSQQSVISGPNTTPVLHIVQNKAATSGPTSNGSPAPQSNTFSGISLVDAGLQQGGNQLLHIVNTGNQKNNNAGQLLKRVNLLTNLTNVPGSNEQKMVQFVCKSADGKAIQLNAPHQRSMVLRLQPIESPSVQTPPKPADNQDLSPTQNNANAAANKDSSNTQEIKSRSVYEENYAKFIQNSSNKPTVLEKSTSLPKFNQAFGKTVFQDGNQKQNEINSNNLPPVNTSGENTECPPENNSINLDHIGQISSPPLLLRKSPAQTSQAQTNLVQQIKQTIAPMNIQTMHGGVIYTRQIPVNIGGGQTINLITVPSTELIDESGQKQVNQDIEPSIIKIVPQSQAPPNAEVTPGEMNVNDENGQNPPQPQPVLTQMRIKLPMLSKTPQMVSGARVVRPSFFQIQRNVIGGANQPVYQQLVLTAAPPLGQQTIRLPQAQARQIKVPENQSSESMSSSTLEQLREFDMVLEQVKERSTGAPNSNSSTFKLHTPSTDTTDSPASASSTPTETTQVLYSIGSAQPLSVAYVNRKPTITTPTTSTFVRSPDSTGIADSPSSSTSIQMPHTSTTESSSSETVTQQKPVKISSKSKSRPKHHSNSMKINTVPPKPTAQKPLEDEQTTQRILYILAEYKEQVENSPDKDKPAPRRRSNPPTNPSGSSKRKKSSSSSRRPGARDLSPADDGCRTMGSEDSSCGTSQGDCNESCLESQSPQDSPRKVVRKLTFEQDPSITQPRPQPQRNVIVADGQTITVARGTAGKPATAVLMPANYILPVSMVKGGQQIAIVTNRGPKLLTVAGGGEGGATNALLLQRLIGPAGLKPVLARPGVRHVRLPTAALHNLQAFNLATATTIQPPDSTASNTSEPTPPELIDTRAESSPWTDREDTARPDRASSPDESEPWNLPSSADPHEYMYEETVRADNLDRTVLDPMQDRYSPDSEAQRIFDKMFDVDSKKSYIDSPRCAYDIDPSDCDDKAYQVVQKKDGSSQRQTRLAHVSAAALRHKYAILEHELRLQKSLSEECEDLGVDSPSASELFPEAELLFAASPAASQDHAASQDTPHEHTPQPALLNQSAIQPDIDDQIATDQLLPREDIQTQSLEGHLGLEDVGIVTVSEDGSATIALDQEEFARAHPNTTFHSEPPAITEVQPFTISGLKNRHITSTIFHSNRAPATVLMTAPQATVISQATAENNAVKYSDIDNMINAIPSTHNNINLSSVLVKDDGLTRFDNILTDSRELHLSNTASAVIHSAGNATQVIRRVCYDEDKRERERFLMDEPDAIIAGDDAKMVAEDSSRDATLCGDVDDGNSSPERHAELFWESNSASERSESRRPLDFSSDSEKCCKSPSYDETNSTDSSGVGAHMRLDSVIKEARGVERSGSADGFSADDTHPPLRTYPAKRLYHSSEGDVERSLSGKTRAGERSPDSLEVRRRASGRGVVKRGCHCCNGSPAPQRPKKPRQKKPTMDFTN